MNERFKFRVWDNINKRYVKDMHFRLDGVICYDDGHPYCNGEHQDDFTIEQCTGLKDVSGNFIFENDVVRVNTYCDAQPEYKVILWKECYSGYLLTSCDLDGSYSFYYGGLEFSEKEAKEYVSIVGNVHTWQDKK